MGSGKRLKAPCQISNSSNLQHNLTKAELNFLHSLAECVDTCWLKWQYTKYVASSDTSESLLQANWISRAVNWISPAVNRAFISPLAAASILVFRHWWRAKSPCCMAITSFSVINQVTHPNPMFGSKPLLSLGHQTKYKCQLQTKCTDLLKPKSQGNLQ